MMIASIVLAAAVAIDGIYPHLAMQNDEGECGTGAVVPWAGSLWVVTYGPHCPVGSSDKLYQITPDLKRIVHPESVGGTPANRLIHRETNQLLIGPYVIDAQGRVRVVPPSKMPGRLTGAARHITDPAHKVYVATMDNGLYALDMTTLAVQTLQRDHNGVDGKIWGEKRRKDFPVLPDWDAAVDNVLPGSHTKGACSGFGRIFLANNGEYHKEAQTNPWIPSGVLGDCDAEGRNQRVIRRCQFTDITTRDGIYGNEHPQTNPIWSLGWDAKSVILAVTTNGEAWAYYRLPKASHCYDGAHGWNTEWPRIREAGLGGDDLLATMHGTFWRFPKNFSPATPNGIRPISTYLKVIGDFCYWKDAPGGGAIVFGCDDHAKCQFLGSRALKKDQAPNVRSTSNLWFVKPEELASFGPPSGEGWVWHGEDVNAGDVSDPYLWAGYAERAFTLRDRAGKDVPYELLHEGDWVRVKALASAKGVSAHFVYGPTKPASLPRLDATRPYIDVTDDSGNVFRFPNVNGDTNVLCREVATERDLLYVGGVFYEVPADNAGGFACLRPIALADESVKTLTVDRGLIVVNGKPCALDALWRNGTAPQAYALWKKMRAEVSCDRVYRPARLSRDNTNLVRLQPIDDASWIWCADDRPANADAVDVLAFRKQFEVREEDGPLTIDVSADERFYLTCDGRFVARGPNRGTVENWQYQTYRLTLAPGSHELRAVVTRVGDHAPLAQLSYRGGFVLKAAGAFDAALTTGKATWEVGRFEGIKPMGADNGVWGTGSQFEIVGTGPFVFEPKAWRKAVVVRGPATTVVSASWGSRIKGWMLFPSQIADQTETVVRPGAFVAAKHDVGWRMTNVYTSAEMKAPEVAVFNRLLNGEAITVPARTRLQLVWNLGNYYCAYPHLRIAGGKGARVSWTWSESLRNASDHCKGQRDAVEGKYLEGYGDVFVSDGGEGTFSAPWFRCGVWCRLDIETKDAPLELRDLALIESRYPLEMESAFYSPEDPSLADIRRICTRATQMCSHEMLFDCPYYEQQMYPGDTRVQLLVHAALMRDDRLIKRAIELYDLATRSDGQCPFNWPTRGTQEGFTYTLCYLCMFGDYVMNHADRAWLRARLPGLRKSMAGCELYENAEGLLENTPGWNFMDWTVGWAGNGVIPNSDNGRKCNAFVNLFWLMAMQSAATTERALGNDLQAQYWEQKAAHLKGAIFATFWNEKHGLLSDLPSTLSTPSTPSTFSEHVQSLAILTDVLPAEKRDECFRHLVEDKDIARTTVYFNYYLFEAYFKMGRADLFQKRLDLWRDYVKRGVRALQESPGESRSDCHAWGAHPIWFMQTGLAGIRSDAPFFARVRVAPQPGSLRHVKARHPHPQGFIDVDLAFDGAAVRGTVTTPVPGVFSYANRDIPLTPGTNRIRQ